MSRGMTAMWVDVDEKTLPPLPRDQYVLVPDRCPFLGSRRVVEY